MIFRVLIADPISAEGLAPLRDDERIEIVQQGGLKGDDLAHAIAAADAVIVRSSTTITRESLARATRLRVIGRAGVGVDNIDVQAATEKGIAVLNAPSGNTISAAELAFALLLSLVRRVPAADRSMRAGEWDRKSFSGTELFGKTLGLIGAGRIGSEVAKRARAFGMRVITNDPYLTPERAEALELELTGLTEVLQRSDILSLHVPLTEMTAGMIGAAEIGMLRKGAYIVNAARGGVINEAALVDALRAGHLAGAALDVFEEEPLPPDHVLRTLPNVVLTPHVGAATAEAQQNVAIEISTAVRSALINGDLSGAVNAPAIAGDEMRRLRPLLDLAERLGALCAALSDQPVRRIEVRYAGSSEEGIRPLASAALIGVFSNVVGRGAVNFVNAIHLAETRGITVERVSSGPVRDHGEYVELRLSGSGSECVVAGELLAERHPRIVRINDFHVDLHPRGTLIIIRNRDVPGVIGRVGSVLGDAAINIAEYHQARLQAGGAALAAVSVDGKIPVDLLDRLRALPDVFDARQVELD